MTPPFRETVRTFCLSWKQLILTDVIYKVIAFILLTPLVALLFRGLLAASESTVLADMDILFFFLGPLGWLCLIIVGALWLGILALELATLMAVLTTGERQAIKIVEALRFASVNAWRVIRLTARLVVLTVLAVAPFLALLAIVYFALLTEHDINYYLKEKPPVFWVALGIGAVILITLVAVLLRLVTGWLLALPIMLFENIGPAQALRISRERATGHRRTLLIWILGWALALFALSALATTAVVGLGRLLVPQTADSLEWLTIALGVSLLLWAGVNLVVNVLGTTTFATLHFNLYREFGSDISIDSLRHRVTDTAGGTAGFRLTRTRLLVGVGAGIVAAIAVGVLALQSVRLEDDVEIMAHRGSSNAAPENTMASVKRAIADEADWVEIDVQETADGKVVVFHDSDFMKVAGVDLKIWNATTAELNDIDIGSWFSPEFNEERVPTLGEVLEQCQGKIGVNIELKYYGHDKQLEQRVVDIVEARGMAASVMVMSLKLDKVQKMKSIRPSWEVGLLMSVSAGNLQKIDVDFLAVNAAFVDRRFIRSAHRAGKKVYVWTVNDPVAMSTMISQGVDGLITDKPALARSVLEQRASMSVPERLVLELAGLFGVVPDIAEQ